MNSMTGKKILNFEEFVSGGHDTAMGGDDHQMDMEMPTMHAELPAHEPVEMDMDSELAMMDEPESHEEGFAMEEGQEE